MNIPNDLTVKDIFRDTYLLYIKYKFIQTEPEFINLISDAREITKLYPYELCEKMLVDVIDVIDLGWRHRNIKLEE